MCSVTPEWPTISRSSPRYNSTDVKSFVHGNVNNQCLCRVSFPLSTKWPAISGSSLHYNSIDSTCSVTSEASEMAAQSLPQVPIYFPDLLVNFKTHYHMSAQNLKLSIFTLFSLKTLKCYTHLYVFIITVSLPDSFISV